jgi:serine phosphatase RsbU (regulator of sigma subunit)/anti-sigma regulatory factor (Ser/Thr protein kinase)
MTASPEDPAAGAPDPSVDLAKALRRIEGLQKVTDAALAYLNLDDLLAALLDRTTEILNADTAAILLVEDDGTTLAARAARGLEEEVERGFRMPIGAGFAGRIATRMEPVAIEDLEDSPIEIVNPLIREKGVRSLLGVPLVVERQLVGVLHIGTLTPRAFSQEDAELLQLVGDRAALAIERDRLYEQHRIAEMLQRSVLPEKLPEIPGLALAARYVPATTEAAVGGDWFDVIPLGGVRLGLTIGDVVGSGVAAAGLMGKLRNAVRAFAVENRSPADIATRLARFIQVEDPDSMATFIYCDLNLHDAQFTMANAGHPPPLIVHPDGRTEYVEGEVGPPLGVNPHTTYRESPVPVPPGALLVLYTDGLVERRVERLTDRLEALARAASAAPLDAQVFSTDVVDGMLVGTRRDDDVAVLSVQNLGLAEGPLEMTVSARARELGTVRRLIRSWLHRSDAGEEDIASIALATSEACANAIEHAYGPGDATFEVRAALGRGAVEVKVSDSGRWRPPRARGRGRGMMLMETFMDTVEVRLEDSGTTVMMSKTLAGREIS